MMFSSGSHVLYLFTSVKLYDACFRQYQAAEASCIPIVRPSVVRWMARCPSVVGPLTHISRFVVSLSFLSGRIKQTWHKYSSCKDVKVRGQRSCNHRLGIVILQFVFVLASGRHQLCTNGRIIYWRRHTCQCWRCGVEAHLFYISIRLLLLFLLPQSMHSCFCHSLGDATSHCRLSGGIQYIGGLLCLSDVQLTIRPTKLQRLPESAYSECNSHKLANDDGCCC